ACLGFSDLRGDGRSAVHAREPQQEAGFVDEGDGHTDADLPGAGVSGFDQPAAFLCRQRHGSSSMRGCAESYPLAWKGARGADIWRESASATPSDPTRWM